MHFFPEANSHEGCGTRIYGCPGPKNEHVVRGDASILIRVATWRLGTVVKHRLVQERVQNRLSLLWAARTKAGPGDVRPEDGGALLHYTGRLGLNDRRIDGTLSINGVFG